ncbi:hypothetical protein [Brevibacillus sp. SIMBA_040]|uniref:hypothetical protein n=1 Tax=unclassified Brevibacillus TaxID=2684853 RepID=UPI003978756E
MNQVLTILLIGLIALIGNWIGYGVGPAEGLPGILLLAVVTLIGMGFTKILPFKSPVIVWISLFAMIATSPIFPGNEYFAASIAKINLLALATPILAYAGLSLGKDIHLFKELSWRIVVVSLVVFTGTFLFATLFAEIVFKIQEKF